MKRRLLSLLCTVFLLAGLLSLPPHARAAGYNVTLALTVTATQGATASPRSLTDLRAGDTVTASISTTAAIANVNTLTVGLDFDTSYFTCTDVTVSGLGSQYIASSHTAGWNLEVVTPISDANANGYVIANGTQYLDSSGAEANRGIAADTGLLSVTFTVKAGVSGAAVPFGVKQNVAPTPGEQGTIYLQFAYLANSASVPCTVTSPASVPATVVAPLPSAVLTFAAPDTVTKTYGDTGFTNAITSVKTAAGAEITDHGAITYTSSNPSVALVDASTGAVTIKAAGSAVITATAAAVAGKWAVSARTYSLTVSPKAASLTWGNDTDLVYNGTNQNVTASVSNLVNGDTCAVTVTGGTAKNAGSYTATAAALSNSNYTLPASPTHSYTIAKAARGLANVPSSLTLTMGSVSHSLTPSFSNRDSSASAVYVSSDSTVITVNSAGKVTAVGNGTARVTVTLPDTANYNGASTSCAITAIAKPIVKIASVTAGIGDALTAVLNGSVISVSGFATARKTITITPVYSENVSGSDTITTVVSPESLSAGDTVSVTAGGTLIPYTVSFAKVVILPANVDLEEITPATSVSSSIAADVKEAVADALQNSATKADGLMAAAAAALLSTAENLSTAQTAALAPLGANPQITVSVGAKIEALSYRAGGSLTLEITPVYRVMATTTQAGNTAEPVTLQAETTLPNSVISAPVSVSISLPADFPVSNLFVKHITSSGTEYLPVTVTLPDRTASWVQSSFSSVELYSDARAGSITYTFADGTVQTVSYNAGNLLTSLPTDSKVNSTFNGWAIGGITYTTMTDALLTALNGKKLTAASSFTANGGSDIGGSGGGLGGGGGAGGGVTAATFQITAASGDHGSISPLGDVTVEDGKNCTFTITPDAGYRVGDVLVDGVSVGAVRIYTFSGVSADHKISVTFVKGHDVADLFADISSSIWCHDAVQYVWDSGLMKGTSDTEFSPDKTLNRGMLVTILYRMEGSPTASDGKVFSDVTSNTWCRDAVLWASSTGVVNGFGNGTFGAEQEITRQQFVAILYRYAAHKGYDTDASASLSQYKDSSSLWAADAMRWALAKGILTGRSASSLAPDDAATRGQTAAFLVRFLNNAVK